MSKLLAERDCPQEKQDTILGFFKKSTFPAGHPSPTKMQKQTTTTSSWEKHKTSTDETSCSSDLGTIDVKAAAMDMGTEASLGEILESDSELPDESDTGWKDGGKSNSSSFSETALQKAVERGGEQGGEQGGTVADTGFQNTGKEQGNKAVAEGNARDATTGEGISRNIADSKDARFTIPEHHGCESLPGTSTLQNSTVNSSINPPGKTNAQSATDMSLSGGADLPCASSSSMLSAPSKSYHCNDDVVAFNKDVVNNHHIRDNSSFFVREPTFTCPVCCKPVSCINLTDFNAHIDKCLQPDSQQSADTAPKPRHSSGSKKSRSSPSTSKLSSSQSLSSTQRSQTSQKNVSRTSSGAKMLTNDKQAGKGTCSTSSLRIKLSTADSAVSGNNTKGTHTVSSSASSTHSRNSFAAALSSSKDAARSGLSGVETDSEKKASFFSDGSSTLQENLAYAELDCAEYMVCPVCGAERADWTLETFNQHVDACLNRDAISQILKEQQTIKEQPRKRYLAIEIFFLFFL